MLADPDTSPESDEFKEMLKMFSLLNSMNSNSGLNGLPSINFKTQVEEAKTNFEAEKNLPPKKIRPLSRNQLIEILRGSRAQNIQLESKPSRRNTYIGMPKSFCSVPLCQLRRSKSEYLIYVQLT